MRCIIAGSRSLNDPQLVIDAVKAAQFPITVILHGGCRGIDSAAGWLAEKSGVPVEVYPADWSKYGRAAGPIRNRLMASEADALIAIQDLGSCSHGTRDMIRQARKARLQVYVHKVPAREDSAPF